MPDDINNTNSAGDMTINVGGGGRSRLGCGCYNRCGCGAHQHGSDHGDGGAVNVTKRVTNVNYGGAAGTGQNIGDDTCCDGETTTTPVTGTDSVVASGQIVGNDLVLSLNTGGTITIDVSALMNTGGGGTADGTLTGASVAGTVLTLTSSTGSPVTVDLASIIPAAGADVQAVSGVVNGSNMVVTMSDGSSFNIDVSTLVGGAGNGLTSVVSDNTLSGNGTTASPLGVVPKDDRSIVSGSVVGNNIVLTASDGTTVTFDASALAGTGGGTADGVINQMSFNSTTNVLTVGTSTGGNFTVSLGSLAGGGTGGDGYLTGGSFNAANNILSLNVSGQSAVTIDLSALDGGTGSTVAFATTTDIRSGVNGPSNEAISPNALATTGYLTGTIDLLGGDQDVIWMKDTSTGQMGWRGAEDLFTQAGLGGSTGSSGTTNPFDAGQNSASWAFNTSGGSTSGTLPGGPTAGYWHIEVSIGGGGNVSFASGNNVSSGTGGDLHTIAAGGSSWSFTGTQPGASFDGMHGHWVSTA